MLPVSPPHPSPTLSCCPPPPPPPQFFFDFSKTLGNRPSQCNTVVLIYYPGFSNLNKAIKITLIHSKVFSLYSLLTKFHYMLLDFDLSARVRKNENFQICPFSGCPDTSTFDLTSSTLQKQ